MRALASILVVAALAGVGHGAPDRQTAERLLAEGRTDGDPDKLVACGSMYVDLYNADPEASEGDELLFNAAACFDEAGRVGAAIATHRVLQRYFTTSPLMAPSLARVGQLLERAGSLAQAAESYERLARLYPKERAARDGLAAAIMLRAALGEDAAQLADARLYFQLFGYERPEAARLALGLGEVHERARLDDAVAHYRDYLSRFGSKGGRELALQAEARLGELLLRKACPSPGVEGLCVAVPAPARIAPAGPAAPRARCGPEPAFAPVARDAKLAREAAAALGAAVKLVPSAPDAATLAAYARARLALADLALEELLAVPLPAEQGGKPLAEYLARTRSLGERAAKEYEAIAALGHPAGAIAARARIGMLHEAIAGALLGAPIPAAVRAGPQAAARVTAHCDALGAALAPLAKAATDAYDACLAKAGALGIDDASVRLCASARDRLGSSDPAAAASPGLKVAIAELVPAPASSPALSPERAVPALRSLPRPFADALGELAAATAAGLPLPRRFCDDLGPRFTALAQRLQLADAHYMAGLTYDRCGQTAKAEQAYERALTLAPGHAAAASNLGELAWRAGRPADAKLRWQAASAANQQLPGAHLGLAAALLRELRGAPAGDPARAALEKDAMYQAWSAAAADETAPGPHALLAVIALEGPDEPRRRSLARYYAARAAALDDKPAVVALARAASLERDGHPAALAVLERAAREHPTDEHVRLALGLRYAKLRRWADARAYLDAIRVPSYELAIGRGLVARATGRLADAELRYHEAIALDAARPEAHFDLGVLWQDHAAPRATSPAEAAATLRKAAAAFRRAGTPDALQRAAACDAALAALPAPAAPRP